MPINDKQQAFINEYMINGHNASQAYKKAYPKVKAGWNKLSARLMAKEGIKQEISRRMAVTVAQTGYTVEQCQLEYEQARIHAHAQHSASAEVSAITGKARLFGFDKDSRLDQPGQQAMSEAEAADREAFTEWQLRQGLKVKREA